MEPIKRSTALELNLRKYFTGKPCKYGHIAERQANNGFCIECRRAKDRQQQKLHPEISMLKNRKRRLKIPERVYELVRKSQAKRPEYYSALYTFHCAKRRAKILERTPKWADLQKIKELYLSAKRGFQVDHIIPLQGKLVSGLHVENNLQIIPKLENILKSNKFEVGCV